MILKETQSHVNVGAFALQPIAALRSSFIIITSRSTTSYLQRHRHVIHSLTHSPSRRQQLCTRVTLISKRLSYKINITP
jgi:hypothetical protein